MKNKLKSKDEFKRISDKEIDEEVEKSEALDEEKIEETNLEEEEKVNTEELTVEQKNEEKETEIKEAKIEEEIKEEVKEEKTSEESKENEKENVVEVVEKTKNEKNKKQKAKSKHAAEPTKKKSNKPAIIILAVAIIYLIISVSLMILMVFGKKFKDISVEIGTNLPDKSQFVVKEKYVENAEIITDLSNIDINKVGSYEVQLAHKGTVQRVMLHLVDTTKPEVTFKDVFKNVDYEINPKDFVEKMSDLSELTVELESIPDISEYGEYPVKVIVRDESGNETIGESKLIINWLRTSFTLELGKELKKSDLVDVELDGDKINQKEIDKINDSPVGEYKIDVELKGKTYTTTITVQDTKAPTLTLKDVTVYIGQTKNITKNSFIVKAEDESGKVTTTMKTTLDSKKKGTQEVEIEAIDKNGNKVTKKAKYILKEDDVGPVFYGLSDKTVEKHSTVNYTSGVSAKDAIDGKVEFTVDSSKVNTSKAGTYYATYTAKDSKGNKTTRKRKIIVNHDQEDTNAKFNSFYNQYNMGSKSVLGIVETVRNKIGYNSSWGGSDPVWYGLTNKAGNCYVHAMLVSKALTKKGITNQIIHTKDKTHYWNLVYTNGVWRHYDATPGGHLIGPATDAEKYESPSMKHRDWNRDAYPKAE